MINMAAESYVVRQDWNKTSLSEHNWLHLGRLDMELTERCNYNCIHCCINLPEGDLEAKKKELSTDEIKRILKEAASLGRMAVRFTGGEALLREDFEELYIFARRQGLSVLIFTNASLITPSLADLFVRIPPREKIEISVYGMKKNSYESVTRAPGSFAAAWKGINLLLEKKIPFGVKGVLLSSDKDEVCEFEKWASTIPWMIGPPPQIMYLELRCRRDAQKNELIKKLRFTPEYILELLTRQKGEYIKVMKEFCSKFMRPPGDKLFSCVTKCQGGCVDAYGNFQFCMMLRHPETIYYLRDGSLKDAIKNFFPRIKEKRSVAHDYVSRCAKCFLKNLCDQCPGKSWVEHGTLDTPVEYLCEIAHAQARYLGLIKEYEKAWELNDWKDRIKNFCRKGGTV